MKAMIISAYGSPDVFQPADVERPVPGDKDLLIRVHATSVNYGDLLARNFRSVTPATFNMPAALLLPAKLAFGVRKPKIRILGSEFSGEVVATGKRANAIPVGERVFGYLGPSMGAYAEYLCIKEDACVVPLPRNIAYDDAAVLPYGAVMAWALLRKAGLRAGQKVLIIGASGGIGSAAVQIAKHRGANVTGVCSAPRMEFVRELGAQQVIDYATGDFVRGPERYDLIFDILGKHSVAECRNILTEKGTVLYASFKTGQLLGMIGSSIRGGQKVVCALAPGSRDDLSAATELIAQGALRAIIDRRFPLGAVADAHRYAESTHRRGQVVVTVTPPEA